MAAMRPRTYASSYTGEVESKLDTVIEALKYGVLGIDMDDLYALVTPYLYLPSGRRI
jgi:hypothetical protein